MDAGKGLQRTAPDVLNGAALTHGGVFADGGVSAEGRITTRPHVTEAPASGPSARGADHGTPEHARQRHRVAPFPSVTV